MFVTGCSVYSVSVNNNYRMDLKENFRKSTLAYFAVLLKKLVKAFDQTLFEQANKANSNQEQSLYYEAMQEFRQKSPLLLDHYQQFLSKGIEDFLSGCSDTVEEFSHAPDELTLVDKETLEDELAISIISSKANSRYAESLWKLNRRLAVVRGGKKVDDEQNPCGPNHLCYALQQAALVLEVDNRIKIQLYKMFDKMVMPRAGELYEKLNSHFIDKQVLPNLRFQAAGDGSANEAASAEPQGAAQAHDATEMSEQAGESFAPQQPMYQQSAQQSSTQQQPQNQQGWLNVQEELRQQDLISSIRALQGTGSREGARRTTTAGGTSFGAIQTGGAVAENSFSEIDFAFVLNALQQQLLVAHSDNLGPAKSVQYVESQFIEQLNKQAESLGHNAITNEDADTIDLVGMLFKYVLDDPKLPDVVKSLLSHMHTPMLKVALIDKAFFENSDHPARRLLNFMAEVGGRWITEGDKDKLVYPKLRSIVNRVHEDFVDDLSIFDDLMVELEKFATTLEKRAELAEKRNTEAEMGLERLAKARIRAQQEIAKRMEGQDVPKRARELLEQSWADFLTFNILRHGDQGKNWDSALKVVNGVVWSVQAKASSDIERFRKMQQQLEQSISEGLRTIGYDQDASKALLADLSKAQEMALEQVVKVQSEIKDENESLASGDSREEDGGQKPEKQAEKSSEKEQGADQGSVSLESAAQDQDDEGQLEGVVQEQDRSLEPSGELADDDHEAQVTDQTEADSNLTDGEEATASQESPGDEQAIADNERVESIESATDKEPSVPLKSSGKEQDEEPEAEENSKYIPARKNTAINRQLRRQEQKVAALDNELSAIYDSLENLEFGSWFEFFKEGDQQAIMLKLAWFSSISDHYMFVNRAGVKSAVNTRMELAQGIKAGTIKPQDGQGKTFMERALESILGRLKLSA